MDSATPPAPNGDAPGTGARLDDKEIWRLKHEEHLKHSEIMQRVGCAKGSVTKALQREEARRDQQPDTANRNGEAPGGPTEATPGQTPAVAAALAKATALAKAPDDEELAEQYGDAAWRPGANGWLRVHPAAELLPMMSDTELDDLARDIAANGLNKPIVLWRAEAADDPDEIFLLDGRNRLAALKRVGITNPDYEIVDGVDPTTYVLSANVHRRHLNSEQKRAALAAYLKADPTVSDRGVAKELGTDHKTVGSVRGQLERRGEIPHAEKRTDSKGRSQPAKKPPAKKKPTPTTAPDAAERAAVTSPTPVAPVESNRAEPEAADTDIAGPNLSLVEPIEHDDQDDEHELPDAIQARDHHDYQVRELDSAAQYLEDAADVLQHELDNGLVLSPQEVRELAERIDPALNTLLILQEALEELGAGVVTP